MDSLISVIIPVYNASPYLKEALDSVIEQTYENLEIIVVDDGSTDDSGSICDEYRTDPRVIVIHQQHQGVSSARNAGLDRITGEYVAFLDSDDALDLSFMQTMLEVASTGNADIVACKYHMLHSVKGKSLEALSASKYGVFPISKPGLYKRKEALLALWNGKINIEVWNKIYKSELWKNNRFPTGYDVAEDVIASYHVFDLSNTVCVIDRPLYFHRGRSESLSSSYTEKCVQDRILYYSDMEKFIVAHTPEIFSEECLLYCKQARLQTIIIQFANVKDRVLSNKLKEQAVLAEQIGMENCRFKLKAGYFMIRICPWLLRALYPIYYPIRIWIRKIRG